MNGEEENLSFANLKVKPALAVGGHAALRLFSAHQLHVNPRNRLVIFVQHLAGQNTVRALQNDRPSSRRLVSESFSICCWLLPWPGAVTRTMYCASGGRHLIS